MLSVCRRFNGTKTNYCTFTVVVRDGNDDAVVFVFAITIVISFTGGKMCLMMPAGA